MYLLGGGRVLRCVVLPEDEMARAEEVEKWEKRGFEILGESTEVGKRISQGSMGDVIPGYPISENSVGEAKIVGIDKTGNRSPVVERIKRR